MSGGAGDNKTLPERLRETADTSLIYDSFGDDGLELLREAALALEAAAKEREALADALGMKMRELGVAYGDGSTSEEREWFSALDRVGKRAEAAEARVEAVEAERDEAYEQHEKKVFEAVCAMFPDYAFDGCYDTDELLSHTAGQVAESQARVVALTDALRRFGVHPDLCAIWVELDDVTGMVHPVGTCDCGLDAVLASSVKQEQGEGLGGPRSGPCGGEAAC